MKIKLFAVLAVILSLLSLAGCGILDKIIAPGETVTARPTVRVTVPEGYTVYQIAMLLEEKGVCPGTDFIAAVNTPPADNIFAAAIPNAAERPFLLEGYVFPDTYDFYVGEPAVNALDRFLSNMKTKLTDADYARAAELGYTMDQIITIASLIQEEAGMPAEDVKVSSVIYNRLGNKNYPLLQLDASYEYLDNSVEPLISGGREKYNDTYNTYVCKGLPAGPICSPGRASVDAALYPADTAYYFYRTDKNRNFYYAETYDGHLANGEKVKKADASTVAPG